jgi:hypothetical protein
LRRDEHADARRQAQHPRSSAATSRASRAGSIVSATRRTTPDNQHDLHRRSLAAPRARARGRAELDDRRRRRRCHGTRLGLAFTREATLPAVQPLLVEPFLLGERAHRQPRRRERVQCCSCFGNAPTATTRIRCVGLRTRRGILRIDPRHSAGTAVYTLTVEGLPCFCMSSAGRSRLQADSPTFTSLCPAQAVPNVGSMQRLRSRCL